MNNNKKGSIKSIFKKGSKKSTESIILAGSVNQMRENSEVTNVTCNLSYGPKRSSITVVGDSVSNSSEDKKSVHKKLNQVTASTVALKEDNNNESEDDEFFNKPINNAMHKFYRTRLKHSLIISFLLLIPIQNICLCFISLLSEKVIKNLFY
jgi:hypothetical protein